MQPFSKSLGTLSEVVLEIPLLLIIHPHVRSGYPLVAS